MSAQPSHGADLTPMLDMVFQLITFFMLIINFKGAAMDLTLKLPVLGSARPLDTHGQEQLIMLNIDAKGILKVMGVPQDAKNYIGREAKLDTLKMQQKDPKFSVKNGGELPTTVVIRADKVTPFKQLNDIIKTCQDAGYRKFALKAMTKVGG